MISEVISPGAFPYPLSIAPNSKLFSEVEDVPTGGPRRCCSSMSALPVRPAPGLHTLSCGLCYQVPISVGLFLDTQVWLPLLLFFFIGFLITYYNSYFSGTLFISQDYISTKVVTYAKVIKYCRLRAWNSSWHLTDTNEMATE